MEARLDFLKTFEGVPREREGKRGVVDICAMAKADQDARNDALKGWESFAWHWQDEITDISPPRRHATCETCLGPPGP